MIAHQGITSATHTQLMAQMAHILGNGLIHIFKYLETLGKHSKLPKKIASTKE